MFALYNILPKIGIETLPIINIAYSLLEILNCELFY